MQRSFSWLVAGLLISCLAPLAHAQEMLRVYPAGEKSDDSRLTVKHDVDHPADFKPSFADKAAWEKRAAFVRTQVLVANGLWPMPEKTPLKPVIHGKIDRDEYTIEKVFFASMTGHYVSGNLYRPKRAGKHPAVLCPHGHWKEGRFMRAGDGETKMQIESGAEKWIEGARSPLQARCAMLARMGCVVFHYDMVGYADSAKIEHRKGFSDQESVLRLQSQMGLQTWNSIRALDFVQGLEDVDPARIGVTGSSGGGTQTFILAAVDPRVSVSFPAVMVGMNMQGGCVCENAPLLRVGINNVELAATFAPRPQAMSAANDWTVDLETRGLPELRAIYKLYDPKNVDSLIAAKHFPFPHNYNQVAREMMYGWMSKHLRLGPSGSVPEKPFTPVPPEELSVYDKDHPRPDDAADAAGVRNAMTEQSDRQLAELAKDPAKYRAVIRTALQAMIADVPPTRTDIRIARTSGPQWAKHVIIEKGLAQRKDNSAGGVPFVAAIPTEWDGRVVIWAHPDGKSSVLDGEGKPVEAVTRILASKAAVLTADLFMTGELSPSDKAVITISPTHAPQSNPVYSGFHFGYNRSTLANRTADLLTLVALARNWQGTKEIRIVGVGKAGPWVLLAKALAGDGISRTAVDLDQFDFDKVTEPTDPMMLPGALKYGGIYGFVPSCTGGKTLITNARKTGQWDRAAGTEGVTLEEKPRDAAALVAWVLE
jgi:dienelactone hydrolase